MKIEIGPVNEKAEKLLPENRPDDSGVGINYTDAYLKPFKLTLDDGRKLKCKRRGLKLTLEIGDAKGEGLLRRLEHGPDVQTILRKALEEAAAGAGARFSEEDGVLWLELE
jgi:hypothetical protein